MLSARRKRQLNRKLLKQLDDFDQDFVIGNAVGDRHESATVNEGTGDQDFTVGTSDKDLMTNVNTLILNTLERCFNEKIEREMINNVQTVEEKIRNVILTAIESIVSLKIDLANRSIITSAGQDATSVTPNSERVEHIGITAPSQNVSESNESLHVLNVVNVNDGTQNFFPDKVNELSVPGTPFDRQPHTYHKVTEKKQQTSQIPEFPIGFQHHATYHHTNIRTCQHKHHKSSIYHCLNNHEENKTQTQEIPLIV